MKTLLLLFFLLFTCNLSFSSIDISITVILDKDFKYYFGGNTNDLPYVNDAIIVINGITIQHDENDLSGTYEAEVPTPLTSSIIVTIKHPIYDDQDAVFFIHEADASINYTFYISHFEGHDHYLVEDGKQFPIPGPSNRLNFFWTPNNEGEDCLQRKSYYSWHTNPIFQDSCAFIKSLKEITDRKFQLHYEHPCGGMRGYRVTIKSDSGFSYYDCKELQLFRNKYPAAISGFNWSGGLITNELEMYPRSIHQFERVINIIKEKYPDVIVKNRNPYGRITLQFGSGIGQGIFEIAYWVRSLPEVSSAYTYINRNEDICD